MCRWKQVVSLSFQGNKTNIPSMNVFGITHTSVRGDSCGDNSQTQSSVRGLPHERLEASCNSLQRNYRRACSTTQGLPSLLRSFLVRRK